MYRKRADKPIHQKIRITSLTVKNHETNKQFATLWRKHSSVILIFSCSMHDFDYSSILSVERHQIKRVRDNINHYKNHLNWEQDVASMNLALKLLDIIEEIGEAKMIGDKPFETDEKGYWKPNPNGKWELDRYVNHNRQMSFLVFLTLMRKIIAHNQA